jgi:hypothetical protein
VVSKLFGLVVTTSPSHGEGREFEPRIDYIALFFGAGLLKVVVYAKIDLSYETLKISSLDYQNPTPTTHECLV